jgi:hypothetical protein
VALVTEDQLLARVIVLCDDRGYRVYHSRDSRRDQGKGFPDLVIAGCTGVLFRELKDQSGRLEREQTVWKWRLHACRANWGLWRPADLESGRIERELEAIRSEA